MLYKLKCFINCSSFVIFVSLLGLIPIPFYEIKNYKDVDSFVDQINKFLERKLLWILSFA